MFNKSEKKKAKNNFVHVSFRTKCKTIKANIDKHIQHNL